MTEERDLKQTLQISEDLPQEPPVQDPEPENADAEAPAEEDLQTEDIPELEIHRGKRKRFKLDWVSVLSGVLVFALLTSALVYIRHEPEQVIETVAPVVVPVITGNDINETITKGDDGEEVEKLSEQMKPISIDESSPLYEPFMNADRVNFLLMGVNGNMTDTMMLGSYDMENQVVDIISVPRDTYYYRGTGYANYGFHKINSIYRTDGAVAAATAVSTVLYGMPIHYYAVIDYNAIKQVMKVLGGVEYNVPFAMRYVDNTPGENLNIDIPAGLQTIDASNVIEFLRFRHTNPSFAAQGYKSYNDGDIGRIKVQQQFVVAALKKTLKSGKITDVIKAVLDNTTTDLTYDMAIKVAAKATGFDMANINTYMLPGTDKMINELSFWVQNENDTLKMLEQIYRVGEDQETDEEE